MNGEEMDNKHVEEMKNHAQKSFEQRRTGLETVQALLVVSET